MKVKFLHGSFDPTLPVGEPMGSFGEELRKERLARGFALEDISAVTKISQRHLIALEEEKFRLLPGGILSKGIVRGYAGAIGLDPQDWTERFLAGLQHFRPNGGQRPRQWLDNLCLERRQGADSCAAKLLRSVCAGSAPSFCYLR